MENKVSNLIRRIFQFVQFQIVDWILYKTRLETVDLSVSNWQFMVNTNAVDKKETAANCAYYGFTVLTIDYGSFFLISSETNRFQCPKKIWIV